MKQVFYIRNLACAECAGKIEAGAHRLPGVRSARLNFASGRIALELDDRSAERKVRDGWSGRSSPMPNCTMRRSTLMLTTMRIRPGYCP